MSGEEDTFNKLRRLPIDEVLKKLQAAKPPSPMIRMGGLDFRTGDYYAEIQSHLDHISILEENGWNYKDFLLELEKNSVLSLIKDFNDELKFPEDLINRTKKFFPNAKFTQASVELE